MTPGESRAMLSPMRSLFLFFLLTSFVHAAPTTGTTEGCPEKAELIAREGDRFVIVKLNGRVWKLTSDKPFCLQGQEPVTFTSTYDPMKGMPSLEFQMTSVVMSSLPRLIVSYSGRQDICRVKLYGPADKKQN